MAPINYVPGMLISSRVFPCPRKSYYGISPGQEALNDARVLHTMLIYGQKPSSPPPATLTQEQLARDAGQLVEAHALLDKLCDDTDRSQHSLVHRLKQILLGSEAMNRVLEKAGFNTAAGLLDSVRAMAKERTHFKDHLGEAEKRNVGYLMEIDRLKERNKRLHDAQGSGSGLAAEMVWVRKQVLAWFPGGSAEAQAKFGGLTLPQLISELVTTLGDGSKIEQLERVHNTMLHQFHGLTYNQAKEKHAGYSTQSLLLALLEDNRVRLTKAESEAGRDPALFLMVQQAHGHLNNAGIAVGCDLNIEQRVKALVGERDKLKSDTFPVLRDRVQAAHLKLNTVEQLSTFGTIDERVASLVDVFKARVAGVPLEDVQSHLKLNELPEIERTGTLLERVSQVVAVVKDQGQRLEHCRAHLTQACRTFGVPNPANMIVEGMAMAVNERATGWGALHADAHRMFDKAGIPNGTLDERVRVAIERGQQPKVSPDAAHCVKIVEECTRKLTQADVPTGNLLDRIQLLINDRAALLQSKTSYGVSPTLDEKAWEVRNRDNRVMAVCTSLADAQRIRASLEAR